MGFVKKINSRDDAVSLYSSKQNKKRGIKNIDALLLCQLHYD